jgi:hypothetical protein
MGGRMAAFTQSFRQSVLQRFDPSGWGVVRVRKFDE